MGLLPLGFWELVAARNTACSEGLLSGEIRDGRQTQFWTKDSPVHRVCYPYPEWLLCWAHYCLSFETVYHNWRFEYSSNHSNSIELAWFCTCLSTVVRSETEKSLETQWLLSSSQALWSQPQECLVPPVRPFSSSFSWLWQREADC